MMLRLPVSPLLLSVVTDHIMADPDARLDVVKRKW
jgi:hypothetical protein